MELESRVQVPDRGAAQKSRHTTESVPQLPLERGTRHLTGKPVLVFGHPHSRETSPNAWTEPPQAQLCADPHMPLAASGRGWCLPLRSRPQEAAEVTSRPPSLQETTQVPSGLCPHSGEPGMSEPRALFPAAGTEGSPKMSPGHGEPRSSSQQPDAALCPGPLPDVLGKLSIWTLIRTLL